MNSFDTLVQVMERLRRECPWDREQTHQSLKTYVLEEVYEVIEAIDENNDESLAEELGDLQIQILFHAIVAQERGTFYLDDIFKKITDKLIRRHPHIFGDVSVKDSSEVLQNWEHIKKNEKVHTKSVLDGVPIILPALLKAYRVQSKAARIGFDWKEISGVWEKINEEINELKSDINLGDPEKIREELGDLFFSIVNLARFLKADPEDALRIAIDKFIMRFKFIEAELEKRGKSFQESSLEEMDQIWELAKKR